MGAIDIINKLSDFIIISGGEALLYDRIYDVISYLSALKSNFTIISNGRLLTENNVKKLNDNGLKNISMSIDSYKSLQLDKFMMLKDTFDDVSACIMYDKNIVGKLYGIVKNLSDIGVWSIIQIYNFKKSDNRQHLFFNDKDKNYAIEIEDRPNLVNDINNLIYDFDNLLIHNSKEYIKNIPNHINMNWHCGNPYRLVVDNNLDVLACEDLSLLDQLNVFDLYKLFLENKLYKFVSLCNKSTSICSGCYMSCAYESESLTSSEISHSKKGELF